MTTTGNVGIGTTLPTHALSVNGAIRIGTGASDDDVQIRRTAATLRQIDITSSGGSTGIYVNLQMDNGRLAPITDNTGDLGQTTNRWNTLNIGTGVSSFAGNVGIGTTSPQTKLAISDGNVGIGTITADGGRLIVQGGNVGIGTWAPIAPLHVNGQCVTGDTLI